MTRIGYVAVNPAWGDWFDVSTIRSCVPAARGACGSTFDPGNPSRGWRIAHKRGWRIRKAASAALDARPVR